MKNILQQLKEESKSIVNKYGYSESVLDDDDYLHDFLIDFKTLFNEEEYNILIAYNSIFQYRIANQISA